MSRRWPLLLSLLLATMPDLLAGGWTLRQGESWARLSVSHQTIGQLRNGTGAFLQVHRRITDVMLEAHGIKLSAPHNQG